MDELEQYQRCAYRLRKAANKPGNDSATPSSYADLLRMVQELQRNVALQTMEANAKLALTKTTRDRLRDEIPQALSLVAPHRLSEFRNLFQGPSGLKTSVRIKTPLSGRKRLNKDGVAMARKLLDREAAGNVTPKSPKIRTPVSARKLLQSKSLLCNTPVSATKSKRLFAINPQFALSPMLTPEMPRFRRPIKMISERKSVTKILVALSSATSPSAVKQESRMATKEMSVSTTDIDTSEVPTNKLSMAQLPQLITADLTNHEQSIAPARVPLSAGLPKATPEMKQRILFFNNPNIENIHQRYVAIQDSEEQTCLLSKKTIVRKSNTPERPIKGLKAMASSTPSLPLVCDPTPKKSVTPDMPVVRRTPATGVNITASKAGAGSKMRLSKTPSPPRFTAVGRDTSRAARLCLASKLDSLPSGQDEREIATRFLVAQRDLIEDRTPEKPISKRVTFKPPVAERSKTCVASVSTSTTGSFNYTLTGVTEYLLSGNTRSTPADKASELKECFKPALTEMPLVTAANCSNQHLVIHDVKSGSENDTKPSSRTNKYATIIHHSTCQQVQPVTKYSENNFNSRTQAKTPIKCSGSKIVFKPSAKTPVNHILSVSIKTDEKSRTVRPSKMQRHNGK